VNNILPQEGNGCVINDEDADEYQGEKKKNAKITGGQL
jgi:hypothetical protein